MNVEETNAVATPKRGRSAASLAPIGAEGGDEDIAELKRLVATLTTQNEALSQRLAALETRNPTVLARAKVEEQIAAIFADPDRINEATRNAMIRAFAPTVRAGLSSAMGTAIADWVQSEDGHAHMAEWVNSFIAGNRIRAGQIADFDAAIRNRVILELNELRIVNRRNL